jgi:hypothetical protein
MTRDDAFLQAIIDTPHVRLSLIYRDHCGPLACRIGAAWRGWGRLHP